MHRFCHRCQTELPAHDEGTLIFCSHCGAPQVLLSEDLQTQVETQAKAAEDGANARSTVRDPRTLVWAGALRSVALAGAIAAGLACVSILLPPVILLVMFWAVTSPVVAIGLFQARFPLAPMTTSFGARIGLLTGLAVSIASSIIFTAAAAAERLAGHVPTSVDKQWLLTLEQMKIVMASQPNTDVERMMQQLAIPEFHAGMMVFSLGFFVAVLVTITTVGGAFAGFVRSRSRA